jgi:hypothetical protein
MLLRGRCHCENISFDLIWMPEPSEIPARACSCSFCIKHGAVWTSCPGGSLSVNVKHAALVSKYAFGTKTANFHTCTVCGVAPVAISQIDGGLYAVINVNTFDGVPSSLLRRASTNFDSEDETSRLARRKRNWTPNVVYVEGSN